MPVLHIETDGNPEDKKVEVVGTSSEFSVDTFGKPRPAGITLDPKGMVLNCDNPTRVAVAIRRGEQYVDAGEFPEALAEYQKALDVSKNSSLAHYRIGEVFFLQGNYQTALNSFRRRARWRSPAQMDRGLVAHPSGLRSTTSATSANALNEYQQALRTKDDTQGALEEAQKYIDHPYERVRTSN